MKAVIPHTEDGLKQETLSAVIGLFPFVELANVDEDEEAYWRLLRDLWANRNPFILIEQDIVPHATVRQEFEECPAWWCAFGYPYDVVGGTYYGSGCVRFRAELIHAVPDLWDLVGRHWNPDHPPRHWCSLDAFCQHELANAGYTMHRHDPPVGHLDTRPSHGCVAVHAQL